MVVRVASWGIVAARLLREMPSFEPLVTAADGYDCRSTHVLPVPSRSPDPFPAVVDLSAWRRWLGRMDRTADFFISYADANRAGRSGSPGNWKPRATRSYSKPGISVLVGTEPTRCNRRPRLPRGWWRCYRPPTSIRRMARRSGEPSTLRTPAASSSRCYRSGWARGAAGAAITLGVIDAVTTKAKLRLITGGASRVRR